MLTMLRRLFWLGLLGGAGYAGWALWQRRSAPLPAAAPEWPPMPRAEPAAVTSVPADVELPDAATPSSVGDVVGNVPTAAAPAATTSAAPTWVEPVDGACPEGYPVKANDNSGIYHVPGGRFYERTVPERCYARTEDAEADGYRAAKA